MIKLLYKKDDKNYLVIFNDTSQPFSKIIKSTSAFNIAFQNIVTLKNKEKYYEDFKKEKFQPPLLKVYPYRVINIKIGTFKYNHTSVDKQTNINGILLTNEPWFKKEIEMVEVLEKL
jgi:hypothetical protein